MLVSATEMINKAHEGHYAIGAFNINNLEWTKAILAAAEEAKSPEPPSLQKIQPPVPSVPSLFGQVKPPSKDTL